MNKCKLVQDLLPLYLDGVLSDESCDFVERHLAACPVCKAKEEILRAPLAEADARSAALAESSAPVKNKPEKTKKTKEPRTPLSRVRRKMIRRTCVITFSSLLLCAVIVFSATFFPPRVAIMNPDISIEGDAEGKYSLENVVKNVRRGRTYSRSYEAPERSTEIWFSSGDGEFMAVQYPMPDGYEYNNILEDVIIHEDGTIELVLEELLSSLREILPDVDEPYAYTRAGQNTISISYDNYPITPYNSNGYIQEIVNPATGQVGFVPTPLHQAFLDNDLETTVQRIDYLLNTRTSVFASTEALELAGDRKLAWADFIQAQTLSTGIPTGEIITYPDGSYQNESIQYFHSLTYYPFTIQNCVAGQGGEMHGYIFHSVYDRDAFYADTGHYDDFKQYSRSSWEIYFDCDPSEKGLYTFSFNIRIDTYDDGETADYWTSPEQVMDFLKGFRIDWSH